MRGKHDKEIAAALGSVSSLGAGVYSGMKAPEGEGFDAGMKTVGGSFLGGLGGGMVGYGGGSALALLLRKNPAAFQGVASLLGTMAGSAAGAHASTKNRKEVLFQKLGLPT